MMESDLSKIYAEFDYFYRDIMKFCCDCNDHDCEGYVWLLDDEAELLYTRGVSIVEINDNISFIHSFEEKNGEVLVDKPRPPCVLRNSDGSCSVYDIRPLVCRMYPVGLVTCDNEIFVALHKDCKFSRSLDTDDKINFNNQLINIFKKVSKEFLDKMICSYKQVDFLSLFPEGSNTFEVIIPFKELYMKGGE